MDKSMTWILVALVVAFLVFSDTRKAPGYRYSSGTGGAYPVPGPAPLGTSWAQQGPYPPATAQTNGWDVANSLIGVVPSLVNAFGSGGGSGDGGEYVVPYEENGLDFTS